MRVPIEEIKFDERGLVPAIVQDANTRQVLTLAYMNAESLKRTIETNETWFWSRSRSSLWHKGEISGHTQRVLDILVDCDNDSLTILVKPNGPACHTGEQSCFHNALQEAGSLPEKIAGTKSDLGDVLNDLYLATLSRAPADGEVKAALAHVAKGKDKRKAWEDVQWALVNSKEFLFRH